MQSLSERVVLLTVLLVLGIGVLFWIIGIAAPGFNSVSLFKFASSATIGLCVVSLLLLVVSVVFGVANLIGNIRIANLPLMFVVVLIIASIFSLSAIGSLFPSSYSWNLLIASFAFTYLSSLAAVFWLGTTQQLGLPKITPGQP